jgi:hypothetical protein
MHNSIAEDTDDVSWLILSRIGLGRLPGNIVIQRGNALITGIVLSIVLSALFWLFNR